MVVEDRRAAGERELGEPGARRGVLGLGVDSRPHRVELAEPAEEIGLLRAGAGQRLVEVVVGVDEPGRDDRAAEVDAFFGRRLWPAADLGDDRVVGEQPAVRVLRAVVVARHDPGVGVERAQ